MTNPYALLNKLLLLMSMLLAIGPVKGQLVADFTVNGSTTACGSLAVGFEDQSSGNPSSWFWDFGNGLHSTLQNPVVVYNTAGVYSVSLVVSDSLSTNQVVLQNLIEVYENPLADFTVSQSEGCAPMPVSFEDLSISSAPIVSWFWDFGDGGNDNLQNPNYSYHFSGDYTVALHIEDSNGCQSAMVKTDLLATDDRPLTNFEATPEFSCSGAQQVVFTNTTIGDSTLQYEWLFGDGSSSGLKDPNHLFVNAGGYDVQLVAKSAHCLDTLIRMDYITVDGILSVDFSSDVSVACGPELTVQFTDLSSLHATEWLWDFGDGQTSSLQHPQHTYVEAGVYDVSLTVSVQGSCIQQEVKTAMIEVLELPQPAWTSNATQACEAPFSVQFNNLSAGGVQSAKWFIGDTVHHHLHPLHVFTEEGEHDITLEIVDFNACIGSTTFSSAILIEKPNVDFSLDHSQGCAPLAVQFENHSESSRGVASNKWVFGDGDTSSAVNPIHVYMNGGDFDVQLEVVDSSGCIAHVFVNDAVKTSMAAHTMFTASADTVCGNDTIVFTDLSTSSQAIDSWYWDFGYKPVHNTGIQHPVHVFQDTGHFNVSLITTVGGCADTLTLDSFVYVASPIAKFYTSSYCGDHLDYRMFNSSLNYDSCIWNFGDGTVLHNPSLKDPFHTFPSYGQYDVELSVYNAGNGCWGSVSRQYNIEPPIAGVAIDSNTLALGCPPLEVKFVDVSSASNTNLWNRLHFGNGAVTASNFQHTYTAEGYYDVTHMVANDFGCRDTIVYDSLIHVLGVAPAVVVDSVLHCDPFTVSFRGEASVEDSVVDWIWDFGTSIVHAANPVHLFTQEGYHDVQLSVITQGGCEGSVVMDSLVHFQKPEAVIASPLEACWKDTLTVESASTGIDLTYAWLSDNGTVSMSHLFTQHLDQQGLLANRLIVRDAFGCSDTVVSLLDVQQPVAAFTVNNVTANCPPIISEFTDLSQGAAHHQWSFGDGSNSSLDAPSHLFVNSGSYDVSLIIESAIGCRDTFVMADAVSIQGPMGEASIAVDEACAFEPVGFLPNVINTTQYLWDFGDGTFSIDSFAQHAYDTLGIYHPRLFATNSFGCMEEIEVLDSILVSANTVAIDLGDDLYICKGDTTQLSLSTSGSLLSWSASSHLSDSTSMSPLAFPPVTTQFIAKAGDMYCSNQDTLTVFVEQIIPEPLFQSVETCKGKNVQLQNLSLLEQSASFEWTVDGQLLSQAQHFTHQFNNEGVYKAALRITYDSSQCAASYVDSIQVRALPIIDIDNALSVCEGDSVTLSAVSGLSYNWGAGFTSDTSFTFLPHQSTTLGVIARDLFGCESSEHIQLTVKDLPVLEVVAAVDVCEGAAVHLSAKGNGNFVWGAGLSFGNEYSFFPDETQLIDVTLEGGNTCVSKDSVLVNLHKKPQLSIALPSVRCVEDSMLLKSITHSEDEVVQWEWKIDDKKIQGEDVILSFKEAGTYDLQLKAVTGYACVASISLPNVLKVHEKPMVDFYYLTQEELTDIDNEIQLHSQSEGAVAWEWQIGEDVLHDENPTYAFDSAGVYSISLSVWNEHACAKEISKEISVEQDYTLYVPNAFTPNGDGVEDVFYAKGYGVENFEMTVFDRWGGSLFVSRDIHNGWDGTISGKIAAKGVYNYKIRTEDARGKIRNYYGEINLIY
jgi:gliding motility-associated-like protein